MYLLKKFLIHFSFLKVKKVKGWAIDCYCKVVFAFKKRAFNILLFVETYLRNRMRQIYDKMSPLRRCPYTGILARYPSWHPTELTTHWNTLTRSSQLGTTAVWLACLALLIVSTILSYIIHSNIFFLLILCVTQKVMQISPG